jgi:putative sterol carrier protein
MLPRTIQDLFAGLPAHFDAAALPGLSATYQFRLSGEHGRDYHVIVRERTCAIHEGLHRDPDVTLSMSADDCLLIMSGKLNGVTAALSGRVKLDGDLALAMHLKTIFPTLRP